MKTWYNVKSTHGRFEVWFCYENSSQDVQRILIGDVSSEEEIEGLISLFKVASDTKQVNYR